MTAGSFNEREGTLDADNKTHILCRHHIAAVGSLANVPVLGASTPTAQLPQPPVRRSSAGLLNTTLRVGFAANDIGAHQVYTRTYEGMIPGPTLRVKPGDALKLKLQNELPPNGDEGYSGDMNIPHEVNTTNLHLHGAHLSPLKNSDNVFLAVPPGEAFDYEYQFPTNHWGGFFWYHSHKHGAVYQQLRGGMSGGLIVDGPLDEVPEISAAKDVLMVIHELELGNDGEVLDIVPTATVGGDVFPIDQRYLTINGVVKPEIHIKSGEVQRWRINNATSNLFIPLSVDGHLLHIIANDGIAVGAATPTESQFLSPGNRVELLIKGGVPGRYALRKQEYHPSGSSGEPDYVDLEIGTVVVHESSLDMPLPTKLPVQMRDITDDEITGKRTVAFGISLRENALPGFLMDGKAFDPNRIDQRVRLGTAEEWTITNDSIADHPFHIHTNPFQVTHVGGVRLDTPVWADTFNVKKQGGTITLRTRFEDFEGLIVAHCHVISHADFGMMQTVNIAK